MENDLQADSLPSEPPGKPASWASSSNSEPKISKDYFNCHLI